MKKIFVITLMIVLTTLSFTSTSTSENFVLSIVPQHPQGLFVEFTSIGFSFGNSEISTQPLFDVIGAFNLKLRYYPTNWIVINNETYLWDPFFINKAYLGESIDPNYQMYILLNMTHLHSNFFISPVVVRPFVQTGLVSVFNPGSEYVTVLVGRGFLSAGILATENIEIFSTIEGGMLINVWQSANTPDDWESIVNEARQKSLYATARAGFIWYYDRYSGLELGYRLILHGADSPLRFIQGYSFTDYIYNYFSALYYANPDDPRISIPFITTDYYLSFTTKF
ncbi:hypothetical protein MNL76_01090 [Fervidobacterium riparium]|uniref:Uncharacterized protein n=2 Tax=Fervidobacterium TaxID=2422 RepID=A0A1M7SD17_FERGO|nr:hypothetical protein [Fervidobacterium gondwanense]SHN56388.1 hypothetical protein SAMN02745226_00765 [Fervidobacterium gondwanense DSM 13020]